MHLLLVSTRRDMQQLDSGISWTFTFSNCYAANRLEHRDNRAAATNQTVFWVKSKVVFFCCCCF